MDVILFEEPLNSIYVRNAVINNENFGVHTIIAFILTFGIMVFSHKHTKRVVIPVSDSAEGLIFFLVIFRVLFSFVTKYHNLLLCVALVL